MSPHGKKEAETAIGSVIDLRSDTFSLPTRRMRAAIGRARLGDETFGEDPTVRDLEDLLVDQFGFEAAMLCVSATMCNLVALLMHCSPGSEIFLDRSMHVLRAETGGLAGVAGVVPTVVDSRKGHPTVDGLREAIHPVGVVNPRPQLVWLENTHNRAGGTVMPIADQMAVADLAHGLGLRVHIDGARVFNAAQAQGLTLREVSRGADSMTVDFTKSMSCPMGAMLLGTASFIEEARRARRRLGGGMRQAGIIAAAALEALSEDYMTRLDREHRLARHLARGMARVAGLTVDPTAVETNMVYADARGLGSSAEVAAAFREVGVLVSESAPWRIRLVIYRGIHRASIDEAVRRMEQVSRYRIGAA